jgi:hypothetical protein
MPRRKRSDLSMRKLCSAITNGSHILHDVDERSAPMRRYRDLILAHEMQLGGEVSHSESQLIRRAAMITLQLELLDAKFAKNGGEASALDLTRYQQATNSLLKILMALGLQKRARDISPTLGDIIRQDQERQRERLNEQRESEPVASDTS